MRLLFSISWLVCLGILFVIPHWLVESGRYPSGTFPLDGARTSAIRYQYLVFPKVHHIEHEEIRKDLPEFSRAISHFGGDLLEQTRLKDSLVDYANPVIYEVLPLRQSLCRDIADRYRANSAALRRAIGEYWSSDTTQCNELIVTIVDNAEEQHLDFKAVKRETGRILVLNNSGGALAQMILYRDDVLKVNSAFVQPLDPNLDIGSGFSIIPLDWPRLETHRQNIKSENAFRVPADNFVYGKLRMMGQLPKNCESQLLGLKYRDSWGRTASAQWCYGDTFPKTLENEHYYAIRLEE